MFTVVQLSPGIRVTIHKVCYNNLYKKIRKRYILSKGYVGQLGPMVLVFIGITITANAIRLVQGQLQFDSPL